MCSFQPKESLPFQRSESRPSHARRCPARVGSLASARSWRLDRRFALAPVVCGMFLVCLFCFGLRNMFFCFKRNLIFVWAKNVLFCFWTNVLNPCWCSSFCSKLRCSCCCLLNACIFVGLERINCKYLQII